MELNNKSLFKQECFIGGKWINSLSGETIEVENPATQKKSFATTDLAKKYYEQKLIEKLNKGYH